MLFLLFLFGLLRELRCELLLPPFSHELLSNFNDRLHFLSSFVDLLMNLNRFTLLS